MKQILNCVNFRSTELWQFEYEGIQTSIFLRNIEPTLYNYYAYPELFVVDKDYCTWLF